MTASISTRGMNGACFTNQERERMYMGALQYYSSVLPKKDGFKIVFAENSGWDLTSIKNILRKTENADIEFISLSPACFDISKGKGYNELLLINHAIELSTCIRNSIGFMKVTGRYPIYNIRYFLDQACNFILEGGGFIHRPERPSSLRALRTELVRSFR